LSRSIAVAALLALVSPLALVALLRSLPFLTAEMGPAGADYLQGAVDRPRFDGRRWSTPIGRRGRVSLPVTVEGGSVAIALSQNRTSPTRLEVHFDDGSSRELLLSERIDSHEVEVALPAKRVRAGIRLRQTTDGGAGEPVRLSEVRFHGGKPLPQRPLVLSFAAFVFVGVLAFSAAGLSSAAASSVIASLVLALFAVGRADPLAALHLSQRAAPLALAAFLVVLAVRAFRPRLTPAFFALLPASILLKGSLLFHPDFYFTDLRIHETLLELAYHRGVRDFVVHFPDFQIQHNVGVAPVGGEIRPFPYPVFFYLLAHAGNRVFHAPELWLKLTGALVASLPLLGVGYLARRLSPDPRADLRAGLFYLLIPSLTRSLLLLELSALLGHLLDLLALCCLARVELRLDTLRRFFEATAAIAAALAAYTSGFVHFGLFVGSCLSLDFFVKALGQRRRLALAGAGLLAAAIGLTAYLPERVGYLFTAVLPEGVSGAAGAPVGDLSLSALGRALSFLGAPLILAGVLGLALRIRQIDSAALRLFFYGWAASAGLAYLLRFVFLELFHYQKEMYWVGALLALGASVVVRTRAGSSLVLLAALAAYVHAFRALIDQFYRSYLFL
jgi:hypothetical protein